MSSASTDHADVETATGITLKATKDILNLDEKSKEDMPESVERKEEMSQETKQPAGHIEQPLEMAEVVGSLPQHEDDVSHSRAKPTKLTGDQSQSSQQVNETENLLVKTGVTNTPDAEPTENLKLGTMEHSTREHRASLENIKPQLVRRQLHATKDEPVRGVSKEYLGKGNMGAETEKRRTLLADPDRKTRSSIQVK